MLIAIGSDNVFVIDNFRFLIHSFFKTKIRVETRNPSHLSMELIFSNLCWHLILYDDAGSKEKVIQ